MKNEYVKPDYNLSKFTCFHCNKLSVQESFWWQINSNRRYVIPKFDIKNLPSEIQGDEQIKINNIIELSYETLMNKNIGAITFLIKICLNCGERSYWEVITPIREYPNAHLPTHIEKDNDYDNNYVNKIYPHISSIDQEPNEDLDEEIKQLFNEAKDIFDKSPKAAGALLRCILEKILREIFKEKHSKSYLGTILNDENVKNKIGKDISDACMACKIVGNESVHSSLLIFLDEDKKDVEQLFRIINLIADKFITQPKKEKNLLIGFSEKTTNQINKKSSN